MLAKIIANQPAVPGTAQLMVRLRGDTTTLSVLTFTLCNNQLEYLQPDASWSAVPHWFTVNGGYTLGNGIGFHIGSTLLDPLLATASQVQIQVKLSSGEMRTTTLQLVRDELLSSDAKGETADYSGSSLLAEPESYAVVEPITTVEPIAEPEPEPEPESIKPAINGQYHLQHKAGSSRLLVIGLTLLVLVIIASVIWWFLSRDKVIHLDSGEQVQQTTPVDTSDSVAKAGTRDGCAAENLNSLNELEFVQSCVQQKLDSNKLLAIIESAKEAKKCGVAQRLYANRAQGGDTKIALAYAREYDPQYHQLSECFQMPDKDTAVYWYETVLQTEPDNQVAKQRIKELGE